MSWPLHPRAFRAELEAHVVPSVRTALEALSHNTLRAGLTSLGILFGVASVIAMLAIGKGAEQEILAQMRLLGTNNIVVRPLVEQREGLVKEEDAARPKRFSPGLGLSDAESVREVVGAVDAVSGEVVLESVLTREGHRRSGKLVGVEPSYFELFNLRLVSGALWATAQAENAAPVCVIGDGVRARFFTTEPPLGRTIKVGEVWLTVIGVLEDRKMPTGTADRLGIRDANMDVYLPLSTMLLRYRNRAQVTNRDVEQAARTFDEDGQELEAGLRAERANQNQLDRIVVRVREAAQVPAVADVLRRMLLRRHNQVIDFEVVVPELLLKQEQRTKTIFNLVLGAIASISLVVGGIGIMNIMLASVLERIREIGVRRAVGATRRDILSQFLAEAMLISLGGGIAGILLGAGIAFAIERFAGIRTIVSGSSVAIAFGVSLSIGVAFGILPAWRAAEQDPIVSLRYE
ncbi:MAG: ABC transporter permease [Candidatus Eisenbacteria bacterium]